MVRLLSFAGILIFGACVAGCTEVSRQTLPVGAEVLEPGHRLGRPSVATYEPRLEGSPSVLSGDIQAFYRIAKTDTIFSVAERFYGDRSFVREIEEANQETFAKAGGFKRGLVIALPKATRPPRQPRQASSASQDMDAIAAASAVLDARTNAQGQGVQEQGYRDFTDVLPAGNAPAKPAANGPAATQATSPAAASPPATKQTN